MAGTHATILFGTSQFKKWTGTFKPYDYTFSLGLLPSNDNCLPLSMAPRFTKSTSLSRDTKTEWEDTMQDGRGTEPGTGNRRQQEPNRNGTEPRTGNSGTEPLEGS
jgi:hypothetical protein